MRARAISGSAWEQGTSRFGVPFGPPQNERNPFETGTSGLTLMSNWAVNCFVVFRCVRNLDKLVNCRRAFLPREGGKFWNAPFYRCTKTFSSSRLATT